MHLRDFSKINIKRCRQWHDPQAWSLSDWACAATGELGEACNIIKKINRLDGNIQQNSMNGVTRSDLIDKLCDEIADTVTYLDLLAQRAGIDLQSALIRKFNEISRRENINCYIEEETPEAQMGLMV